MSKTVVQQMIDFVTSDEYNHLYPNVKQEWFNTFLEKEKQSKKDTFYAGTQFERNTWRYSAEENDRRMKDCLETV